MGHKWHAWQDRDQGQRFAEVLIQRRVCLLHDCCDVQCFCIYLKRVIVLKFVPEDWEFGLRFTSMRASHNWGKSLTVIGIGSPHHDHNDPMGPRAFITYCVQVRCRQIQTSVRVHKPEKGKLSLSTNILVPSDWLTYWPTVWMWLLYSHLNFVTNNMLSNFNKQ